jgi:MFS family permease
VNRNLWSIVIVSVLAGLSAGLLSLGFLWYCDFRQISYHQIGWITSLSALISFIAKAGLGRISDRAGRKYCFAGSILLGSLACAVMPEVKGLIALILLNAVISMSRVLRDNFQALAVFDNTTALFRTIWGRAKGLEMVVMGVGMLLAGRMLAGHSLAARDYRLLFWFTAAVGAIGVIVVLALYREPRVHAAPASVRGIEWGGLSISRHLWILAIAGLLFNAGISTSHALAIPFFFERKFGVAKPGVGWIQFVHLLVIGVPMLVSPRLVRGRLKGAFIASVVWEGFALMASALIPSPHIWWAVGVWLTHDLIGASFWLPIQAELVQRYSRPERRGADASFAMAVMDLGIVAGPLLSGYLMEWRLLGGFAISSPFFVSGAIVAVSSLLLVPLPGERTKEGGQ